MTNPLHDANVLLTGATGGLGPHLAGALAAAGANLVLTARDAGALARLTDDLAPAGVRTAAVPADLGDPADVAALVARAEAAAGPVDVLVHNAATDACAPYELLTAADVERVVAVNLTAPLELTRRALPGMLDRGRGHVVFVSSLSGVGGTAFEAPYAATKGALLALTRSLRAEFADRPVGFSAVVPGSVSGPGMFGRAVDRGVRVPRSMRLARPASVAAAVVRSVATDAPRIVVYPGPVAPLLALGAVAPRAAERLEARLGLARFFEPAARSAAAGRPA
jgi:short-subunit dehydrogenase